MFQIDVCVVHALVQKEILVLNGTSIGIIAQFVT